MATLALTGWLLFTPALKANALIDQECFYASSNIVIHLTHLSQSFAILRAHLASIHVCALSVPVVWSTESGRLLTLMASIGPAGPGALWWWGGRVCGDSGKVS